MRECILYSHESYSLGYLGLKLKELGKGENSVDKQTHYVSKELQRFSSSLSAVIQTVLIALKSEQYLQRLYLQP